MINRANQYLKFINKEYKKSSFAVYVVIFLVCVTLAIAITLPIKDHLFDRFAKSTSSAASMYPSDTTLTNIATPNVSRPGYLLPYTDPTFGTKITRISDQTAFGSSNKYLRHAYAKISPFNSDGSKIMLSYNWPAYILDGATYKFIRSLNNPSYSVWSNTNPNYIYGVNGNQFVRVDLANNAQTTTLRTFTGYDSISLGEYEGNLSNDDQFVAFLAKKGTARYLLVYNIATNTIISTLDLGGRTPDWASMSQSGNYVVVSWAPDGSSRYQGMEIFDRNLTFQRQIDRQSSHGDMGYNQAGQEVYVSMVDGYYSGSTVRSVRLDGGGATVIIDDTPGFRSGHISCRNLNRPGWCYLTSFTMTTTMPGYDEIFALKIDNSNTVERFGHMHRTNTLGYDGQAHGSVNRDGTKVMFASDWNMGAGSPIYSYIAEMASASNITPTRTPTPAVSTPTPTRALTPTVAIPTPTSIPAPSAPSMPQLSGLPSCASGTYNSGAISWSGTPLSSGEFAVNIATSPTFSNFYTKQVRGSSTDLANYTLYGGTSSVTLIPGTTYYVRIYNGVHSQTNTFSVPVCSTPTPTQIPVLTAPTKPQIAGLPSCATGSYNTGTISWSGTPLSSGEFGVNIATSPTFNTFYNKRVTATATDLTQFVLYGGTSTITLIPGTTYYARVYNGIHSQTNTFRVPVCSTP